MSTVQLSTNGRFYLAIRAIVVVTLLLELFSSTVSYAGGRNESSKPRAVISERYAALQSGDIRRYSIVHKDATWIKESEFQAQRQSFLKYRVTQQKVIKSAKQSGPVEVYIAVDEYYKGQSAPTKMHFTVRFEKDRWLIDEFNADEPRSPTEKEVEEAAKQMLRQQR